MQSFKLLPRRFIIVGCIVIALAYLVPILMGMLHLYPELSGWKQEVSKTALLIGLLLIVLTGEKTEDEFTNNLRLRSAIKALILTVFSYLGWAIYSILKVQTIEYSAFRVLFLELSVYLILFHLAIRGGMFKND
jgi:uncharacterized membrane protein (DUF441 family)